MKMHTGYWNTVEIELKSNPDYMDVIEKYLKDNKLKDLPVPEGVPNEPEAAFVYIEKTLRKFHGHHNLDNLSQRSTLEKLPLCWQMQYLSSILMSSQVRRSSIPANILPLSFRVRSYPS